MMNRKGYIGKLNFKVVSLNLPVGTAKKHDKCKLGLQINYLCDYQLLVKDFAPWRT
jgi:hypothetical protein